MGTYSFFLATRGGAADCQIDWSAMDTEILFKSRVLERCHLEAATLEDVAKEFNESKLFSYLDYDLISALLEFNQHLRGQVVPRIYFSWEGGNRAYGLEFHPGAGRLTLLSFNYSHLLSTNWSWEEYRGVLENLPDRVGWEREELGSE